MKNVILFFVLAAATLNAADTYTFQVNNEAMADIYFNIFNGMASMFTNSLYLDILHLAFLIGGFFVFSMGVFKLLDGKDPKESIGEYVKYTIAVTFIMLAIFGGERSTLLIQPRENIDTYICKTEDIKNDAYSVSIPGILPEVFALVKGIGNSATDMAASVFANISSDSTINSSFTIDSKISFGETPESTINLLSIDFTNILLSTETLASTVKSDTFGETTYGSLIEFTNSFYQNCLILIPGKEDSLKISNILSDTANIEKTLDILFNEDKLEALSLRGDIRYSYSINEDSYPSNLLITFNGVTSSCKNFWNELEKKLIDKTKEEDSVCASQKLKKITFSQLYSLTNSEDLSNMATLTQLSVNSAIQNTYMQSKSSDRIINDINYASNKSMAQLATKEVGTGYYMAKMLPFLESALRAILYAFFPFVFIFIILPGGFDVMKSYFLSILWVELWSPVAAVLNMFLNYFSIDQLASATGSSGVTILNSANIVNDSTMLGAVAGYLYPMVPALTWLVISGTSFMLNGMFDRLTSVMAKNLDSESVRNDLSELKKAEMLSEKTGKNMSMAEVEFNQAMGNAAQESEKESLYYNLNNGDYLANKTAEARKDNVDTSKKIGGGNTDIDYNKLLSSGAYEQMSENKRADYLSGLSEGELKEMAAGSSMYSLSNEISKAMVQQHIKDSTGSYKQSIETAGRLSSAEEVGKIIQQELYNKGYAEMHNMNISEGVGALASTEKIKVDQASTDATSHFMEFETENTYQSKIKNLSEASRALGIMKAVDTLSTKNITDLNSFSTLVDAETSKETEDLSRGYNLENRYRAEAERMGIEYTNLKDMVRTTSILSESNKGFSLMEKNISNDTILKNGITYSTLGKTEMSKISAEYARMKTIHEKMGGKTIAESMSQYAKMKEDLSLIKTSIETGHNETLDSIGVSLEDRSKMAISAAALKSGVIQGAKIGFQEKDYYKAMKMYGALREGMSLFNVGAAISSKVVRAYEEEIREKKKLKNFKEKYQKEISEKMKEGKSEKKAIKELEKELKNDKLKVKYGFENIKNFAGKTKGVLLDTASAIANPIDTIAKGGVNALRNTGDLILATKEGVVDLATGIGSKVVGLYNSSASTIKYLNSTTIQEFSSEAYNVSKEFVGSAFKSFGQNVTTLLKATPGAVGRLLNPAIIADLASNAIYNNTDDDSLAHVASDIARSVFSAAGEGLAVVAGDIIPAAYYYATGDKESYEAQFNDMQHSLDRVDHMGKSIAANVSNYVDSDSGVIQIVDRETGNVAFAKKDTNGELNVFMIKDSKGQMSMVDGKMSKEDLEKNGWDISGVL